MMGGFLSGSQWRGDVCDRWSMLGDHPAQWALRPGIAPPHAPPHAPIKELTLLYSIRKEKNAQSLQSKKIAALCFSNILKFQKNARTSKSSPLGVNIFFCSLKFHRFQPPVLARCLLSRPAACLSSPLFPLLCSLPPARNACLKFKPGAVRLQ